jgi:hypothetical protein
MKNLGKKNEEILSRIDREFSNQRRLSLGRGRRYPQKLRKLALSAVDHGQKIDHVAVAAGITSQSLINWRNLRFSDKTGTAPTLDPSKMRKSSDPCVRELILEENANASVSAFAVICEGNQVRLEIPISALNVGFLRQLIAAGRE